MDIHVEKTNEISLAIRDAVGHHMADNPVELASALIGSSASALASILGLPHSQALIAKVASAGHAAMADACLEIRTQHAERN
jgi:hypothetical protein